MTISMNAVFPMTAPAASTAPAAGAPALTRAANGSSSGAGSSAATGSSAGTGKGGATGAAAARGSGTTGTAAGAANDGARTADEGSTPAFGALLEEAAGNAGAVPVDPAAEALAPPAEADATVSDPATSIAEATFAAAFPEAAATAQGAPVVKPVDLAAHKPVSGQGAARDQTALPQATPAGGQDGAGQAVAEAAGDAAKGSGNDAPGARDKDGADSDARLADAALADAAQQVLAQTPPAGPGAPPAAAQALLSAAAQAAGGGADVSADPAADGIKVDAAATPAATPALAASGKGAGASHAAFSAAASTQGKDAGEAPTAHAAGETPRETGPALADAGSARGETATLSSPVLTQTFAPVASRPAALPYPASTTASPQGASVTVQEGQFGTDMGVQIARALDAGGNDLLIKLDPRHMGRIDVRLSFDHDGVLRAVMSADSSTAAEMLRRESTDLNRALADAGIRADGQSLRFDTRAGGGQDGGQNGNSRWQGGQGAQGQAASGFADSFGGGDDPVYRSLRSSGHVDLMA